MIWLDFLSKRKLKVKNRHKIQKYRPYTINRQLSKRILTGKPNPLQKEIPALCRSSGFLAKISPAWKEVDSADLIFNSSRLKNYDLIFGHIPPIGQRKKPTTRWAKTGLCTTFLVFPTSGLGSTCHSTILGKNDLLEITGSVIPCGSLIIRVCTLYS